VPHVRFALIYRDFEQSAVNMAVGEESSVGAVTSYLLKKIADVGLAKAAETLRKSKGKLDTDAGDVESALNYHLRDVKNWSSEISFSDLRNPKATASVYVPLNVFLASPPQARLAN
jgi:hypothetical protein